MALKILVVDNHPMILKLMLNFLEKEGHQVVTANDGLAALSVLETYTPDIAFVDLVMPNISGDKLCRIIRSIPRLENLFIVILSAIAAEEEIDYREFGANACIAKGSVKSIKKHVLEAIRHMADKSPTRLEPVANLEDLQFRTITRELLSSKNHFEAIINNMSEAVFEVTSEGTIIFVNLAAQALCEVAEEKLLAASLAEIFAPDERERIADLLAHPERFPQLIEDEPVRLTNGKHVALNFLKFPQSKKSSLLLIAKDISGKHEAEQALLASETRFRELFDNMTSGVAVYEAKNAAAGGFIFVDFNQAAGRIEKISKGQVIGRSLLDVFPGARDFGIVAALQRVWQTGRPEYLPPARYQDDRNAGWRENHLYKLPSGEIVAIFDDVSARKEAEGNLALESAANRAVARISQMILSSAPLEDISGAMLKEVLFLTGSRHGVIDLVDQTKDNLLAMAFAKETMPLWDIEEKDGVFVHSPHGLVAWVKENRSGILANSPATDHRAGRDAGGRQEKRRRILVVPAIFNDEFLGIIAVADSQTDYEKRDMDILGQFASLLALAAQKKQAQDQIAHLAHHDPLTGLTNRHLFPDRLAQAMILSQRHHKKIAILYVDLDKFKQINDLHGHLAGDAVLKESAARLRGLLRDSDTVARMGGDEFVVILQDIAGKSAVQKVAKKIVTNLAQPIFFNEITMSIVASVGISIYPDDARDIDALVHKADKAMYQAKKSAGDKHVFYGE